MNTVELARRYHLQSYSGNISINHPAQGDPYNTAPPSERLDLWDVTVPYPAVREPTRFVLIPGEPREACF